MFAKQARYIETSDPALHFLLIPRGGLELGYDLFGLTKWEAEDFIEEHGSVQEWLRTIYLSRDLRREFMRKGFYQASESGRFSSFNSESNRMSQGEVIPNQLLTFDGNFLPGTIKKVHCFPGSKPGKPSGGGFFSLLYEPTKQRPTPTGRTARLIPPDFVTVKIDERGNVRSLEDYFFAWPDSARLENSRLSILNSMNPVRVCLIRCVRPHEHYVAFQFKNGVIILISPVKLKAAFYRSGGRLNLEMLEGLMKDRLEAKGFSVFYQIGGWQRRLEQIVLNGRIIAPGASRPNLPSCLKVKVDPQGRVTIPDNDYEHFKWAKQARLDRKRLIVLRGLGPSNIYLVQCIDKNHRYLAFVFKLVIVLVCPVKGMATYWVERGRIKAADLPRKFPDRELAVRNGAQRLSHVKDGWPTRLEEVVRYGRPITYHDHGRRHKRETV